VFRLEDLWRLRLGNRPTWQHLGAIGSHSVISLEVSACVRCLRVRYAGDRTSTACWRGRENGAANARKKRANSRLPERSGALQLKRNCHIESFEHEGTVVRMATQRFGGTVGGQFDCDTAIAQTARCLVTMFDLHDCWFEPFPFDTQLPRIEPGRIVLPGDEPGLESWSLEAGVELPVRFRELTVGRYVLLAKRPTAGVALSPSLRSDAITLAAAAGEIVAARIQISE